MLSFQDFTSVVVPTNPEEFWALVSAVVSGVVLWVAVRGLRSLKLTREGMLNQAHRDARGCAIARCEEFAAEIIPMNAAIVNAFAALRTPVFVEDAADVRFDPDNRDDLARAEAWFGALPPEVRSECIALMNRMRRGPCTSRTNLRTRRLRLGRVRLTFAHGWCSCTRIC